MDFKIKKDCPNCSRRFTLLDKQGKSYIPLQLPCGHNICHNCIKNKVKFSEPVTCRVCNIESVLSKTDREAIMAKENILFQNFSIDFYLYGQLAAELEPEMYNTDVHVENKHSRDYYINVKALLAESTTDDYAFESNICSLHMQKPLEYYCMDCDKVKCSDCVLIGREMSCKNHNIGLLQETTLDVHNDLKVLEPVLDETLRRLSATAIENAKLLQRIDLGEHAEFSTIINNIQHFFSKIHYAIQKAETKTMSTLESVRKMQKESLLNSRKEICNNLITVKSVINKIDAIKGDMNKVKVIKFLEKAKNAANVPWYLGQLQNNCNISLEVNEDIYKNIEESIKLKGDLGEYKLLSINDIPESVTIPAVPASIIYPPEFPRDVREQSTSQTSNWSMSQSVEQPPQFTENLFKQTASQTSCWCWPQWHLTSKYNMEQPTYPIKSSKEIVFVSHINDPFNFYAQRLMDQELLRNITDEFKHAARFPRLSKHSIKIGKTYLGYSDINNEWGRCRMEKYCYEVNGKHIFELFFFDYGFSEYVASDKLRDIPARWLSYPPKMAIYCKLSNCIPLYGKWTKDDTILMRSIVNNTKLVMFFNSDQLVADVQYDCDILTFEDDLSLAHCLVFHNRASLVHYNLPLPTVFPFDEKLEIHFSINDFPSDCTEEVYITHVESPDLFFVRKKSLVPIYQKLCHEMGKTYNNTTNALHCPTKGMTCAVFVSGNDLWQRGIVRSVLREQRVCVYLPDTGKCIEVHYTSMRRIDKSFVKYKAMVSQCHLSSLTAKDESWSPDAIELFKGYRDTLLYLRAGEFVHHKNSTSVVLHFIPHESDESVCINEEFVKHNFAVAVGKPIFSTIRRPTASEMQRFANSQLIKHSIDDTIKKINKPIRQDEQIIHEDKHDTQKSKAKRKLSWIPSVSLETSEFIATPVFVDNSAVVYVHPMVHKESLDKINSLIEEINKTSSSRMVHKDYRVGEPCLAKYKTDSTFYRARILDTFPGKNKCSIHYVDYGNEEICTYKDIKRVDESCDEILKIPIQVYKFQLAHVKSSDEDNNYENTFNVICRFIINKTSLVRVMGDKVGDLSPVEIKVNDTWLHHHLFDIYQTSFEGNSSFNVPPKYDSPVDTKNQKTASIDITEDWATMVEEALEEANDCEGAVGGTV